ncbi:MAG: alpha/beta hydrolase [Proteobacteria bacterium]|nr:alpha/beta hydrolase [Pseudomonadota bacterium]
MSYAPRRPARHETLVLRGLAHHLTRWGPPAADPLVFLHGWMDSSETFQFLVDAFDDEHPIVALDWRGFGRSAWQNAPYWFPDYLADLDALLEAVAPSRPATLLGHSMGGNIACLYAGVRPERIARVVNLEGFGLPRSRAEQAPGRYRRWLDELRAPPGFSRYDSVADFAALLARRNPRLGAERAAYIAARWSRPLPDGGCTVAGDPAHKLVNPVLYRREEAEAIWREVTAPVLLLLGGRSEFRAHLGADGTDEHFHSLFKTLTLVTLPEAGHMLHHEDPAAVATAVEPFLRAAP